MSEQITLHYQCRLCGKQLDRGIHLGPPSPSTCIYRLMAERRTFQSRRYREALS